MDNLLKQQIRSDLRAANIGPKLWTLTLPKLGETGKKLRGMIEGTQFSEDMALGMHYVIAGEANRIDVFAALAKEATIYKTSSFFTSIKQMLTMIEYDDQVQSLYDVEALFIRDFYDHEVPYPFQGYDRMKIEEVLNYRVDEGKSIFICTSMPLADVKWWSSTLLHRISSNVREFYVGKSNSRG